MADEAKNPLKIDFPKVFEAELESVRSRSLQNNKKRGEGLPDFEIKLFSEGEKPSKAMGSVLDALKDGNENWNKWTKDKKTRGKPAHAGLVGLAFSGGGIRSATFNLGVLQALHKCGLFKHVDYLSTVSGGGYLGACLSSWFASSNEFPFEHKQGTPESPSFRYLRNHANYLAPEGFIDILRMPTLLLRGALSNFLIFIPYILVAVLFTVAIKPDAEALSKNVLADSLFSFLLPGDTFLITKLMILIFFMALALYPLGLLIVKRLNYFGKPKWDIRNNSGKWYSWGPALIAVAAFIELQPQAIIFLHQFRDTFSDFFFSLFSGAGFKRDSDPSDLLIAFIGLISVVATAFSGKFSVKISGRGQMLGLFLVGAFGFLLVWFFYLNLCRWAIYLTSPTWISEISPEFLTNLFIGTGRGFNYFTAQTLGAYLIIFVLLWVYNLITVDVNYTSLHNFYRDRLSKAYLIKQDGEQILHNDEQLLSELNTENAPYHLINAALNVRETKEKYQRGRNSEFFIFSKHYIGSDITGYCETKMIEDVRPHVNLGTAMAISGAAAAPSMGKSTIKPLVFILAMLNVRLNYWLPNPGRIADQRTANPATQPGPWYLLWEAFGRLKPDSWNVNLSDGGHIENLGVYELLRRECRLIIAGDGESDPELKFEGLSEVIRFAQIDFGIRIEMTGLDEIRKGEQQYATGNIHYKGGRTGQLIYLKSSLIGDDALNATLTDEEFITSDYRTDDRHFDPTAYIAHYKANNPSFPHETTGDQFFDEGQFESYRALGYLVGSRAMT